MPASALRASCATIAGFLAVCGALPSAAHAQESGVTIVGQVTDARTGGALSGVVVRIEGTRRSGLSNEAGRYLILNVPPGPQVIRADMLGYAVTRTTVTVPATGTLVQDLTMAETALELEGITVTADPASRAEGELGTASVISEEAIRNQTAASLAGVLELIPGVELTPPGLGSVQQIPLRSVPTSNLNTTGSGSTTSDLASFGTLIVLDGVPLSNNANLQSLGPRGELSLASSAGGGIDLRRIPASTLERVEVIRGVPSARWGDLTQGAIIVETRAGEVPLEARGQFDARTAEGSLVWGEGFGSDHVGTATFDIARTRLSPGVSDDSGYRLASQLQHRLEAGTAPEGVDGARFRADTRVDFFQLIEDQPENPDVRPGFARSNRDRGLRISERALLHLSERTRLRLTSALSRVRQRSFRQDFRTRGALPFTDRLTEGRSVGRYVGGRYIAEVNVEGVPSFLFGRLEAEAEREALGFGHELRAGLELRREWSSGPGFQFDIEFPPQVRFNGVQGFDRPRSYDQIPATAAGAFYVDDRLSRSLGGEMTLNLQAGVRVGVLSEGEWWVDGVRDAVVQPRLNAELLPRPWLRLRGGWGRTAKIPSLGTLWPAPQYHDVINVNWFTDDPAERLAVLTTSIFDPTNVELGFSRGTKAEAGIEVGLGSTSVSLVAFRDEIEGAAGILPEPTFITREHFELTDSTTGDGRPPEIIEPASSVDTVPILIDRPANHIDQRSEGLEITALLPEIRPLRTRIQLQGAWIRTEQTSDAISFSARDAFEPFQLGDAERIPFWEGALQRGEKAVLTYRLIHQQPDAGLVVTLVMQHNLVESVEDVGLADTLSFAGYVTRRGELVEVPPERRTDPGLADLRKRRTGLQERRTAPHRWMASLQVQKTLPLDGRLGFWAFNLFDRRGQVFESGRLHRPYPPMRFGLELSLPAAGFWGGGR